MICRTAPFSITLNDPNPSFKVRPFFDAEYLINGTTYIVSMKYQYGLTHALLNDVISNDLE